MSRSQKEITESFFDDNKGNLVVLLGNGLINYIHYHNKLPNELTWHELLLKMAKKFLPNSEIERYLRPYKGKNANNQDISYQEVFTSMTQAIDENLHEKIALEMKKMSSTTSDFHRRFCTKLHSKSIPIITTNYDKLLENSIGKGKYFGNNRATYLLENYYVIPTTSFRDFSIWHMNGVEDNPKSLRLGFNDYCNYISYLCNHYPQIKHIDASIWDAYPNLEFSWLKLLFERKVIILGLTLNQDEIVLRWLLHRRKRYFRICFQNNENTGWFLYSTEQGDIPTGRRIFLESVGIEPIAVDSYDALYKPFLE